MYAFVRFLEDNLCYALHASCVKDFKPKSRFDFDNQKVYMVYQNLDSEGENCGNWGPLQKAQILALADNKADLENSVMQKKIKIPKLTLDGLSEHEFEELKDSEKISDELGHNKSIQKQDGRKNDGSYRSLEAVVARLEKKNGTNFICNTDNTLMETSECSPNDSHDVAVVPRIMYEELLRNYQQQQQDMRHLQQELERTRRQLVQQAKKLKEYGSLVSEVRELRDLNRRLQDMLLLRLGSDCTPAQFSSGTNGPSSSIKTDSSPLVEPLRVNCPDSVSEQEDVKQEPIESDFELQDSYGEEANTSSYHPLPVPVLDKYVLENGRVHLGNGIWVDEERWHQLQLTQGDSKFTKNLAVMIWGTNVLKNRSVTGVATKKKKDAVPKPPLSPHKLSIVRECLYDRIAQETVDETEIAQRLSKVNKYICEKIMDINKSCKNVERKESKFSLQ